MKNALNTHHGHPPGFTLLEVVFASALLIAVLMITSLSMQATMIGAESTTLDAGLNNKAAAVMDLMARELKDGGTKYSNFSIGSSQQSITFARSVGCSAGKPVFGNQITYAFVTYGTVSCLERTEVVSGVAQKQILTDQLVATPVSVTTAQGVVVTVTGVNFQILASDTVTMTLAIQQGNSLLNQNTTSQDDTMVVTVQASVQMLND